MVCQTDAGVERLEQAFRPAEQLVRGESRASVRTPDVEQTRRIRHPQHHFSDAEAREIGEEDRAGESTQEITDARGINRGTVSILVT